MLASGLLCVLPLTLAATSAVLIPCGQYGDCPMNQHCCGPVIGCWPNGQSCPPSTGEGSCPAQKTVGGGTCYVIYEVGVDTSQYGCTANCTYKKARLPGGHGDDDIFCFKQPGQFPVSQICTLDPEVEGAPDSVLLIGGYNEGTLGHTELYPSSDCDIPALPEKRHFHNAFITNFGRVAICGGRNNSNIPVTDCQVLNSMGWVRDTRIPDLPHPRHRATIATLPSMDTYILGGQDTLNTSLLLKSGASSWVSGPSLPGDGAAYACSVVWGTSFFIIGGGPEKAYTQVQQYNAATGWASEGTWPKLTQKRLAHGCSILDDNIIIAGGWYIDKFLDSTEIISLSGKTIRNGGNLTPARGYFIMATVGSSPGTLYAMGGYGGTAGIATLNTVGRWNSITESWSNDTQLKENNAAMGYLVINKNLVCEIQ